jgi:hypothetical protein
MAKLLGGWVAKLEGRVAKQGDGWLNRGMGGEVGGWLA